MHQCGEENQTGLNPKRLALSTSKLSQKQTLCQRISPNCSSINLSHLTPQTASGENVSRVCFFRTHPELKQPFPKFPQKVWTGEKCVCGFGVGFVCCSWVGDQGYVGPSGSATVRREVACCVLRDHCPSCVVCTQGASRNGLLP